MNILALCGLGMLVLQGLLIIWLSLLVLILLILPQFEAQMPNLDFSIPTTFTSFAQEYLVRGQGHRSLGITVNKEHLHTLGKLRSI